MTHLYTYIHDKGRFLLVRLATGTHTVILCLFHENVFLPVWFREKSWLEFNFFLQAQQQSRWQPSGIFFCKRCIFSCWPDCFSSQNYIFPLVLFPFRFWVEIAFSCRVPVVPVPVAKRRSGNPNKFFVLIHENNWFDKLRARSSGTNIIVNNSISQKICKKIIYLAFKGVTLKWRVNSDCLEKCQKVSLQFTLIYSWTFLLNWMGIKMIFNLRG